MDTNISRIVIIGAGQAGAWAAYTLRDQGYVGVISVVSNEDRVFYERPPLSKQVLSGEMSHDATSLFSEETVIAMDIDWHKPDTAVSVDRALKQVCLASGKRLSYDKLIMTTGSRARVPVDAWRDIKGVHTIRTIDDAESLGSELVAGRNMAIVGGGWIGLEVAATARKKGLNVSVFELGERLCARSVGVDVSDFLYQLHRKNGVDVRLGCGAIGLHAGEHKSVSLSLDNELESEFDVVVLGVGAEIATELGRESGLEVTSGIVVDGYGKTSDPDIYAAGDVAIHPELGFCIQSWANAQNQAVSAAKSLLGEEALYEDTPWLWSDQYSSNIQILGVPGNGSGVDIQRVVSDEQKSFIRLDSDGRLESLVAVNDSKIVKLGKRWIKAETKLPIDVLVDSEKNLMLLKP